MEIFKLNNKAFQNDKQKPELDINEKYMKNVGDFQDYIIGLKVSEWLTIAISGNHECGSFLNEFKKGGFIAKNIYYLGLSGVISVKKNNEKIRIGGISGIFRSGFDFKVNFSNPNEFNSKEFSRYFCTVKEEDAHKLYSFPKKIDIVISHDWPKNVWKNNLNDLLNKKPFFRSDILQDKFANPFYELILKELKPKFWISAHYHVFYENKIINDDETTYFLSLDKNKNTNDKSWFAFREIKGNPCKKQSQSSLIIKKDKVFEKISNYSSLLLENYEKEISKHDVALESNFIHFKSNVLKFIEKNK